MNRHRLVGDPWQAESKGQWQADFLISRGMRPHHRLMDFGCGTLRAGIPIIRYLDRGHYVGIECRDDVLGQATLELEEHGLVDRGALFFLDIDKIPSGARFYCILAFSVFIHLEDDELLGILNSMAAFLLPDGAIYANTNTQRVGVSSWGRFPVVWRPIEFYQDVANSLGLHLERLGQLGALGYISRKTDDLKQEMLRFTAKSKPPGELR